MRFRKRWQVVLVSDITGNRYEMPFLRFRRQAQALACARRLESRDGLRWQVEQR